MRSLASCRSPSRLSSLILSSALSSRSPCCSASRILRLISSMLFCRPRTYCALVASNAAALPDRVPNSPSLLDLSAMRSSVLEKDSSVFSAMPMDSSMSAAQAPRVALLPNEASWSCSTLSAAARRATSSSDWPVSTATLSLVSRLAMSFCSSVTASPYLLAYSRNHDSAAPSTFRPVAISSSSRFLLRPSSISRYSSTSLLVSLLASPRSLFSSVCSFWRSFALRPEVFFAL